MGYDADMATFTLSQDQYEALIALARQSTVKTDGQIDGDKARALDTFLRSLEAANGITRYILWVQWQEADTRVAPTSRFPAEWPPSLRFKIELLTRPITQDDVNQVLAQRARKPVTVLVTPDPGAELGWTPVESFFVR